MKRWAEFASALTLLTRLPMGRLTTSHSPPADCVWAYPLVGLVVGSAGAAVLSGCLVFGLPQAIAALWALATTVLLTGGLHEDGLADMADGFGGGRTTERKLAIMRDSRIGSFGALALLFSVMLRTTALAVSSHPVQALVVGGVLGRGAMLLPVLLLRPARPDGLAAALGIWKAAPIAAGFVLTAVAFLASPAAAIASFAASLGVSALAQRQIGGYTGDVLGAAEQAAECVALCVLA